MGEAAPGRNSQAKAAFRREVVSQEADFESTSCFRMLHKRKLSPLFHSHPVCILLSLNFEKKKKNHIRAMTALRSKRLVECSSVACSLALESFYLEMGDSPGSMSW